MKSDDLKKQALIDAIANLGYPVGMGLGPSPEDAETILNALHDHDYSMRNVK